MQRNNREQPGNAEDRNQLEQSGNAEDRNQLEQSTERLQEQLMLVYPGIHKLEIQAAVGASTLELAERVLGRVVKDGYGAPYFAGNKTVHAAETAEKGLEESVSVSSTEDGGWRLCLTAVHGKEILGIGIDYALSEEFDGMFEEGRYCGGRMFTAGEQAWMEQSVNDMEQAPQFLAELFSAKEAALKSLGNVIREKIPVEKSGSWRMEFKEFEIWPETEEERRAVPFGRTAETVGFLGVRQIAVMTQKLRKGAVSVAVCL